MGKPRHGEKGLFVLIDGSKITKKNILLLLKEDELPTKNKRKVFKMNLSLSCLVTLKL